MKCLYHVDADGKAAGYTVAKFTNDYNPSDYIMINYGTPTESWLNKISKDETVYIVDFSIEPKEMDQLLEITKDVIWIDHHITAINKYKDYPHEIKGLRYDGVAGCKLAWSYFFLMDNGNEPFTKEIAGLYTNNFIERIADNDVWQFKYPDTKKYIAGFNTLGPMYPFEKEKWEELYSDSYTEYIIKKGEIIIEYTTSQNERNRKRLAFELELFGAKVLCANTQGNSTFFGDAVNDYDAVCIYCYNGGAAKNWSYTFYSATGYDCSQLVLKLKEEYPDNCLSAGGHKGAAGAQFKRPIF